MQHAGQATGWRIDTPMLLAAIMCLWMTCPAAAQNSSATSQPSLQPQAEHPHLYFTPQRIGDIKERIRTEPRTAEAWSKMLGRAAKLLTQKDAGEDSIALLSLAYRITGEKEFADKVRQILLAQCNRENWGEKSLLNRNRPWHAGLGLAETTFRVAVGFDSIYDTLSAEDRRVVADGIVRLGIQPALDDWLLGERRIHAIDSMGHNWWSVCTSMAGVGALAVMNEEPRAAEWLNRISESLTEWFDYAGSTLETKPANFDPAGGLYESVTYTSYGVSQYLMFRHAWNNTFAGHPAAPHLPALDVVGDYLIHTTYPNSTSFMSLNFGDGSVEAHGRRLMAMLIADGVGKPRDLWYVNQTRKPDFDFEGKPTPMELAFHPSQAQLDAAPASPDLPPSAIFRDLSWATLRSSWDKDATLLAVKSGFTWNHAHADAGSFILFHRGKYLLIDSGNCKYEFPEYTSYYTQSHAHNVVMFDGKAQTTESHYSGTQLPGSVQNLIDAGELKYVWADATGPTSQHFIRNFRHFLWLGDVILIFDDLKTYDAGQFEWLLHFNGTAQRQDLDLSISQDSASVAVRPLFPETFANKMQLIEKTGLKDRDQKAKVMYYALTPSERARQTKFITALILNGDENPAQIERLEGEGMIGTRIRQNGAVTTVYLNLHADGRRRHENSTLAVNGWQTDAYLLAITHPDGADPTNPDAASRYFVAQGSYLRRDGKVVLDSLSKVFATWKSDRGRFDVLLQGQPTFSARLRCTTRPSHVILNGRPTTVEHDAGQSIITLRASNDQSERQR